MTAENLSFGMKVNKFWELFVFTQKEKRGIVILLLILMLAVLIEILLPYLYKPSPVDFSAWEQETDQFLAAQPPIPRERKVFDPNKTDSLQLVQMGVSPPTASHWIHYLQKGGRFKTKEDVKKIYGMDRELFNLLEPCLKISRAKDPSLKIAVKSDTYTRNRTPLLKYKSASRIITQVDLNAADSTSLENLPGIGPILASRIIRFRIRLGGYYSVEQLREVYGLRPEHFLAASPFLKVKEESCRKLNLNFLNFSELVRHPYIGYKAGLKILKWREQHGKIRSTEELSFVMGEDSVRKLRPYLVFD